MQSSLIVPIITTTKMQQTREFYVDMLGLEISFDHDCYLGVRTGAAGAAELGFMRPDDEAPDVFAGKGVSFGISVKDADGECERLRSKGVAILQPPTDMPWGARAFVIQDPNGVTVMVSHPIAMAVEYEACVK